ncbi:hypothetical protein VNO77_51158 [Canavalia gladiata]|uniref:Uncharacterized protein n=1 Tax=Canavalia gladiata TaxID=3824 RepID=A0AAN9PEP5_CANGL
MASASHFSFKFLLVTAIVVTRLWLLGSMSMQLHWDHNCGHISVFVGFPLLSFVYWIRIICGEFDELCLYIKKDLIKLVLMHGMSIVMLLMGTEIFLCLQYELCNDTIGHRFVSLVFVFLHGIQCIDNLYIISWSVTCLCFFKLCSATAGALSLSDHLCYKELLSSFPLVEKVPSPVRS